MDLDAIALISWGLSINRLPLRGVGNMSRSLKRLVYAILMCEFAIVSTAIAQQYSSKSACKSRPQKYSQCIDLGTWNCGSKKGGCSGTCQSCGGPGGLPAKMCMVEESAPGCSYNNLDCGTSSTGECQPFTLPSGAVDCQCVSGEPGGTCNYTNCG